VIVRAAFSSRLSLCVLLVACGKSPGPSAQAVVPADAAPSAEVVPAALPPPRPLRLDELTVVVVNPWDTRVPRPDATAAEKLVRDALGEAGVLLSSAPDALGARLTVELGMVVEGPAGKENQLDGLCSMKLRFREPVPGSPGKEEKRTWELAVAGQRPLVASERKLIAPLGLEIIGKAVDEAVLSLKARESIRAGDEAVVVAALDSAEEDVRKEALRAVGERHLGGALPRLVELLKNPERRDEAVGGLVALGDPRAVKPLIDVIEFKDLREMAKIVDAVGQIGGEEARSYLDFVASGHEVPEVRALARAALDRL
jgi:hypothetical protein